MFVRSHLTMLSRILAAASVLALGCVAEDDESTEIEAALDEANGAMTTAPEQPAFGDPAVVAAPELVTTFADGASMTAPTLSNGGARLYHVALLWGHLPPAHDQSDDDVEPQHIDWTGSIHVDQGAIGVKKTLRFDPHDSVAPRTDPKVVSFVSHTLPAVDGLLLHVAVPGSGDPVVHFHTAALSADIDLAEVAAKGEGAIPLGDGRNGVAVVGYADTPGCTKGFLFGRWVKLHANLGKFRGRVVDGNGDELGHVKGIWGHAQKHDANLFFGKYIDADGEFRGLFGGTYGGGEFQGRWGTVNPENQGALQGRYFDGFDEGDGRGMYVGRWSEKCGAE